MIDCKVILLFPSCLAVVVYGATDDPVCHAAGAGAPKPPAAGAPNAPGAGAGALFDALMYCMSQLSHISSNKDEI